MTGRITWRQAGFAPIAGYTSALNEDLGRDDPRIARARARLSDSGVTFRPLDIKNPDSDLRRMFALSLESFRHNFLYTPIDEAEFLEQNRAVLPFVQPDLVILAELSGELAGFLFAIPDALQARRGRAVDTIVVKTVAVGEGRARAGLGSVLVAAAQATARELGFTRAIHALDARGERLAEHQPAVRPHDTPVSTVRPPSRPMNIAGILQEQCRERPAQQAVVDRAERLSFADLERAVAGAAADLAAAGLRPGDRALVFCPMSARLYVTLVGMFRLGVTAVFVDPSAGRLHIERCCARASPRAFVATPRAHALRIVSPTIRRLRSSSR